MITAARSCKTEARAIARCRVCMLVGAALALGAFLRLWNLSGESPWLDEVLTLSHLGAPTLQAYWRELNAIDGSYAMVPVYYTVEYVWARVFGTSADVVRGLSLAAGLLSIPLLFGIARRIYGDAAGVVAAFCLAVSLPHVFYSQEVRRYALECLLVLLSFYTLLRGAESEQSIWWPGHLLTNFALLWTTVYGAPLLAVQAFFLVFVARAGGRRVMVWSAINGLALAGLLAWTWSLQGVTAFWMVPPSLRDFANAFLVYAGGRFSNENPAPYLPMGVTLDYLLGTLLYIAVIAGAWFALRPRDSSAKPYFGAPQSGFAVVLLGWLFLTPLFWFLMALVWKPCFLYRYYLYASFPLYIFAGGAYAALKRPWARALFLTALLVLYAYQNTVRFTTPFRPDYRAAARHIQQEDVATGVAPPLLALKKPLNVAPLEYLDIFPVARLRVAYGAGDLHEESAKLVAEYGGLWVITWRWDRMPEYEAFLRKRGIRVERYTLGGMPPLYLYHLEHQAP